MPIECIFDAVENDKRINISYIVDENHDNGLIVAQEPRAGEKWKDGAVVNLTVNRKYDSINSKSGSISESAGKLYLLTRYRDSDDKQRGIIWSGGEAMADDEISYIYADSGDFYYIEQNGVKNLNGESILQVSVEGKPYYIIKDEKILYIDGVTGTYCYDMSNGTNSFVHDKRMLFIVNSNYTVYWNNHDVIIMDGKNNTVIKQIHNEEITNDFALDGENLYYVHYIYNENGNDIFELVKYSIEKDTYTSEVVTNELVSNILAIDNKIVYFSYVDDQFGIKYVDMRTMVSKFYALETQKVYDMLFDGQQIIYYAIDYTAKTSDFYSISIFTGETKKIGSFVVGDE